MLIDCFLKLLLNRGGFDRISKNLESNPYVKDQKLHPVFPNPSVKYSEGKVETLSSATHISCYLCKWSKSLRSWVSTAGAISGGIDTLLSSHLSLLVQRHFFHRVTARDLGFPFPFLFKLCSLVLSTQPLLRATSFPKLWSLCFFTSLSVLLSYVNSSWVHSISPAYKLSHWIWLWLGHVSSLPATTSLLEVRGYPHDAPDGANSV